jgi:hypothetical protein
VTSLSISAVSSLKMIVLLDRIDDDLLACGGAEVGVFDGDRGSRDATGRVDDALHLHPASDVLAAMADEHAKLGHPSRLRTSERREPLLRTYQLCQSLLKHKEKTPARTQQDQSTPILVPVA